MDATDWTKNEPDLPTLLEELTADLKSRADVLIASAGRAEITDDETAGKCVTLAKMIKEHAGLIETKREEQKKPYLEKGRIVDSHYGAIRISLIGADPKKAGGVLGKIVDMIDAYRRKKDQEAAEERRRLEAEAQRIRDEALAAERERKRLAEEAAASDDEAAQAIMEQQAADAEIAQRAKLEEANELARQAESVTKTVISSSAGKASGREKWTATITDLTAALKHTRKINEAALMACVQDIYDRQVKAGIRELPGATVTKDSTTVIR